VCLDGSGRWFESETNLRKETVYHITQEEVGMVKDFLSEKLSHRDIQRAFKKANPQLAATKITQVAL
jgi:ribonuclease I